MIRLYDQQTRVVLGELSDEQFDFLRSHLEEEGEDDRDYYVNQVTVDMLEAEGGSTELIAFLRRAMGPRNEMEFYWEAA